jgi:hypothetical protein
MSRGAGPAAEYEIHRNLFSTEERRRDSFHSSRLCRKAHFRCSPPNQLLPLQVVGSRLQTFFEALVNQNFDIDPAVDFTAYSVSVVSH